MLTAFKTKDMPTAAAIETSVDDDIEHLSQMQNYDGGFAFWDRGYPSEPYLTRVRRERARAREGQGLHRAAGDARPREAYLKTIEQHYPVVVSEGGALGDQRVRAVHAQADGRPRHREGPEAVRGVRRTRQGAMETDGWLLGLFAR